MNLGQAVAVCLYELIRETKAKASETVAQAAATAEIERITILLMNGLRASGYVKPRVAVSTEEKVRRLVRRLKLNTTDAELLMGMLRQMVWKLDPRNGK